MKLNIDYIKEFYPTLIEDSIHTYDNGKSYVFKVVDDNSIHTCYWSKKERKVKFS